MTLFERAKNAMHHSLWHHWEYWERRGSEFSLTGIRKAKRDHAERISALKAELLELELTLSMLIAGEVKLSKQADYEKEAAQ